MCVNFAHFANLISFFFFSFRVVLFVRLHWIFAAVFICAAAYLRGKKHAAFALVLDTWYANEDVIKCWNLWKICMNFFTSAVLLLLRLLLLPFSGFFRFNYFNAMCNSTQQLRYRLRICDAVYAIDSCKMCIAFSHRPCRLNINWNYRELGAVHLNRANTMWFLFCSFFLCRCCGGHTISVHLNLLCQSGENSVDMTSLAAHLNDNHSVAFIPAAQSNLQCDRIWIEQQLVNFNFWVRER